MVDGVGSYAEDNILVLSEQTDEADETQPSAGKLALVLGRISLTTVAVA